MSLNPWRKRKEGDAPPLVELRQEMDRLFDTFMRDPLASLSETFGGPRTWSPTLDVAETNDEVLVRAEIPGVDPKEVEITVVGNRLTIAGEKRAASDVDAKDLHVCESRYGAFRRTIELPTAVEAENVSAEYAHGVLSIRLKKTPAATAKRIEIKVSS